MASPPMVTDCGKIKPPPVPITVTYLNVDVQRCAAPPPGKLVGCGGELGGTPREHYLDKYRHSESWREGIDIYAPS